MNPLSDELGRYTAVESIGGPSDVSVSRAYDRLRSEEVALCQVRGKRRQGAEAAADFGRLSGLDHPSLTRVNDFILTDEAAFYSREIGLASTLRDLAPE